MAGTTGLEPATSAVTGQRSNQLSYVPRLFVQQFGDTSHRIKRFAAFAALVFFYQFRCRGFIWALVDTKVKHQIESTQQQIKSIR
jgi:hypothetical protein